MTTLRQRQIHLDFHTAGQIADVGADWDATAFVETLKRAHVDSITCFARCHHGYIYYAPTRYTQHPALKFDLLGQQIEACHRAGIRVPIYVTVGLDEVMATRHPEWLEISPEGKRRSPLQPGFRKMCLNSPYLDYVWDQTAEVMDLYGDEVDGLFFDIISQGECCCDDCLAGMKRAGLNPEKSEDRQAFARQVLDNYRRRFGYGVLARKPDATVFHNSGHIAYTTRGTLDTYSHLELESLPSTGFWGYDHYPTTVRYARTLGLPTLGMTGKFHTWWGDFSSFKNPAALEFECYRMLANGAACSVGDQMHPRGRLNGAAYDLIGQVYASVEAKEPWCLGTTAQAEIAVFHLEAVGTHEGWIDSSEAGLLHMLTESQQQFNLVDDLVDWSPYRVLILPDRVPLSAKLAAKVQSFLDGGGKVIATFEAGLTPDKDRFALPSFGLEAIGPAPHQPDYVRALPALRANLADTEYVFYDRAFQVRPLPGTQTLAEVYAPYFERTWDHFCSHQHAPMDPSQPAGYPAATMNAAGNVIYFAHPILQGYRKKAVRWYKQMFLAALAQFLPDPLVVCQGPTSLQATVLRQAKPERTIVHLLHYIPERRGLEFDTIEEAIPLYNVSVSFKCSQQPKRVYLAPSEDALPFEYEDGYVRVIVPEVRGHQMIVAE